MEKIEILSKLKKSFQDEYVKKKCLSEYWYNKNLETGIHSTGFCRLSCEVIYKLFGGKEVWKTMVISKKVWDKGSHYYLINKSNGEIFDVSSDQYEDLGIRVPYELGKGTGLRSDPNKLSKSADYLAKHAGLIN